MNTSKINVTQSVGKQTIEIPTDPEEKARLMKYHRVDNDRDLKLEMYREMLKENRNRRM